MAQHQSISDRKTLVDPFDDDDDNSSIQVVDDLSISNIKTLFNPFDDPFDDDDDNSSIQVVDDLSISNIETLFNPFDDPFDDDDDNSSIQVVDDFYFSALSNENEDQMFPISDSKLAEELQLQEALMSSVIASKSSVPPLMMIEEKAKAEEVGEPSHCFCEICVEKKEADEMFRIDICSHSFCSDCISKHDLSTIRTVMSGAAPLRKELEDAVRAKFPHAKLGQGYGMTEAGPVLAMCLAFAKEPFEIKSGACGTVVRNAEMKIVDPDTGFSLPRNQPGEICIRGDQIMKGYLNDPEATEGTIDKQGWLYTGDIGYIDDDDELFIVDRLKELIKYKGFQVAPAELEALLLNHPSISDAAVVPMKEESAGEVPVAFVVRTNGFEVTEDEIKKYISKQVVFYKKINRVFFVDAIPKAPSGKILRKDLRARLAAGIPS